MARNISFLLEFFVLFLYIFINIYFEIVFICRCHSFFVHCVHFFSIFFFFLCFFLLFFCSQFDFGFSVSVINHKSACTHHHPFTHTHVFLFEIIRGFNIDLTLKFSLRLILTTQNKTYIFLSPILFSRMNWKRSVIPLSWRKTIC